MKLSSRLQAISNLVSRPYQHIWDTCCDHGFLGQALLKKQIANKVHFVDIVEHLMVELNDSLQIKSYPAFWKVHCLDVGKLPLVEEEIILRSEVIGVSDILNCESQHLIIIAGVGGERLMELMKEIIYTHPNKDLDFILCPVHHNFKVREYLVSQSMGLLQEVLIKENNRFYEILKVSTKAGKKISLTGDDMWDLDDIDHQLYLQRTIEHYQHKINDSNQESKEIVKLYKQLVK